MPIYAYKCAACGFAQDVLQKISAAPLTVCPSCGQPRFAKQVTAASFQLKGSGWYVTDFRHEGSAPAEGKANGHDGAAAAAPAPAAEAAAPSPAPAPAAPAPAPAASGSSTP
ncbi:MAG: FmdB family zinc ribbon protein [Burkholderiaceae bacterium]